MKSGYSFESAYEAEIHYRIWEVDRGDHDFRNQRDLFYRLKMAKKFKRIVEYDGYSNRKMSARKCSES